MKKPDLNWNRRYYSRVGHKSHALNGAILMTLVIGITFTLMGFHYAQPWMGSAIPDGTICPHFASRGIRCIHYRHDFALGSFFVAICYFVAAGALRLVTSSRTLVDDSLWILLLPFRWIAATLSAPARRFVFDIAIVVTVLLLPSIIISILPGGDSRSPFYVRWEVGAIIAFSALACFALINAYWVTIRARLVTAVREVFIVVSVIVIYIGRIWAGWSLEGVALTVALIAGAAALANWVGLRTHGRS
jgi:hypothetical protein